MFWKVRHQSNFAQVGTEYTYRQKDTFMQKSPQKSKLQHTGNWLGIAWPPGHLCYRPAVFFQCIRLIPFSFPQDKFENAVSSIHYFKKTANSETAKFGGVCKTYYAISAFITAKIDNSRSNHNLSNKRSTRAQKGIRRKSGTCCY
jgi:hypothetical protein